MTELSVRIVIAGGGTSGHINPGLAVVRRLRERVADLQLHWIGVRGRREEDDVPRADVPMSFIRVAGFQRSLRPAAVLRNIRTGIHLATFTPVRQARRILRSVQPHVVLGTGGYVCGPVLLAARLQGIPTLICEQNSIPGLTVRILARIASQIAVSYEATRRFLPESARARIVVTGNPVDARFWNTSREDAGRRLGLDPERFTIYATGGSLGSAPINRAVTELVLSPAGKEILKNGWQILHSTGKRHHQAVMKQLLTPVPHYHPLAYIYDNHCAMSASDIVISRAGATTIAELTALGRSAVLVPWAGAANDHQTWNARMLKEANAALFVADDKLNRDSLFATMQPLIEDHAMRWRFAENSRALGNRNAADAVTDLLLQLAARTTGEQ